MTASAVISAVIMFAIVTATVRSVMTLSKTAQVYAYARASISIDGLARGMGVLYLLVRLLLIVAAAVVTAT